LFLVSLFLVSLFFVSVIFVSLIFVGSIFVSSISVSMLRPFRRLAGRNSNHGAAGFDRVHDNRVRAHDGVVADVNSAQNLRSRADDHVVADTGAEFGIESHVQFPGAERDALKQGHVAANSPRSHDGSRGMREEYPRPDLTAW